MLDSQSCFRLGQALFQTYYFEHAAPPGLGSKL